jgi:hypothetical protein
VTITSTARKWLLYSILMTALSSITMGVVSIEYANHAIAQNQRQWCEIVTTLNDIYQQNPPTTPTGQHLAHEFARLRISFGCDRR